VLSVTANATSITASMSPEVAAEFNKLLKKTISSLPTTARSMNLAVMPSPYEKVISNIIDKRENEAIPGLSRRLMTYEEDIVFAKKDRFKACQGQVILFIAFAGNAYNFSNGVGALPKKQIMSGRGVEYPFTEDERNDGDSRPTQIALELGWKYQGRDNAEAHLDDFLSTCLAIPIDLYYWKDEFTEDDYLTENDYL